jgi:hypothetical protein
VKAGVLALAPPRTTEDWWVLLRWQAMPAAAGQDRTWGIAAPADGPGWPALRLRPGASAHGRLQVRADRP